MGTILVAILAFTVGYYIGADVERVEKNKEIKKLKDELADEQMKFRNYFTECRKKINLDDLKKK